MRFAMSPAVPSLTMTAFSQPPLLTNTRVDGGTLTGCSLSAHARRIDARRNVVMDDNDHRVSTTAGTTSNLIIRSTPVSISEHSWQCVLTRALVRRGCPRSTSMPSRPSRMTGVSTCSTLRSTHSRPSQLETTCRASRLSPNARTLPYRHTCAASGVTNHACAFSSVLSRLR